MKYEDVSRLFQNIEKDCFLCFQEIHSIRDKISKGEIKLDCFKLLEGLFKKQKEVYKRIHEEDDKVTSELFDKIEEFYSAHLFYFGSIRTKGQIDLFEYAKMNIDQTGMLMKYVSEMRKNMETAWFGILQKYGKLTIHISKMKKL